MRSIYAIRNAIEWYLGKSLISQQQYGLISLESQYFRLEKADGAAVHFNHTGTLLNEGDGGGGFLKLEHYHIKKKMY